MLFVKSLLVVVVLTKSAQPHQIHNSTSCIGPNDLIVYRNLDELLDIFRNDPSKMAKSILDDFLMECRVPRNRDLQKDPLGPLIVIEGNHRKTRDYVSKGLSFMLNARSICHPAPCLRKYLTVLPKGSHLRRAFFHLSNYAASLFILSKPCTPTIINGYWTEQLVFTMSHYFPPGQLPPTTDDIYRFPEDMVRPDVIFYLNFPDSHLNSYATTRNPWTWKPRTMEAMRHLQTIQPIVFIDTKPVLKLITEEIYRYLQLHPFSRMGATFANWTTKIL